MKKVCDLYVPNNSTNAHWRVRWYGVGREREGVGKGERWRGGWERERDGEVQR